MTPPLLRPALALTLWLSVAADRPAQAGPALTWDDCLRLAREHNPSLDAAREQVLAARENLLGARSALRPQLSAGASADHSAQDSRAGASEGTSYGASLNLSQSVYSGGRNTAAIHGADASLMRARAGEAASAVDLTFSLRNAFADLLYAQSAVDLRRTTERRRRDNSELVQLRYDGGREHKGSLALSDASAREAAVDVGQALRAVDAARETLLRTIGLPGPSNTLAADGTLGTAAAPESAEAESIARATPAYIQTRAALASAASQVESARSGFRPDVSLSGSAGRFGDDTYFDQERWSVGLKLSFPLWPGGRNTYDLRGAQAGLRQAEADAAETLNSLVKTITDAHIAFRNALEAVQVQATFVQAVELRAEIARQQYEDGLLSFDDWTPIEDDLISRRNRLLDAERAAMRAETAWWRACGRSAFDVPGGQP